MNIRWVKSDYWPGIYYVVLAYTDGVDLCAINSGMTIRLYGTPQVVRDFPGARVVVEYPWDSGLCPYDFIV